MYQGDALKSAINELDWILHLLHSTSSRACRSLSVWPELLLFMRVSIMAARFTFISILHGVGPAQGAFNGRTHTRREPHLVVDASL